MTDQKEPQRPLTEYAIIAKPFIDAAALATGCASVALIPTVESQIIKAAAVGVWFSCFWYWGSGNLVRSKPAQRKPRKQNQTKLVNGKPWTFDQVAPGVLVREGYGSALLRFLGIGQRKPMQRNARPSVPKPAWMTELVFHSHFKGYPLQILVQDAFRFLREAQKLQRKKGRGAGLSERTWVRFANERPLWYQESPCPAWYWAMMELIYAAERYGEKQLIVEVGPRQIALAREANQVLDALRWLEDQRKAKE